MKHYLFVLSLILFQDAAFSQDKSNPIEVTPQMEKKINADIEKEVAQQRAILVKGKRSEVGIEFDLDTFRIDTYSEKYMEYDWSTAGMRTATYEAAHKYDSLLNKYYKKLLVVLKDTDRQKLIQAQKSWIKFRDDEMKLILTISKDEYSGGGTMQQLIDAGEYLELVRERTITIYQYLERATQDM